jgi:alkylation response protein AidB-like acyl-CoA dehydrogenase
MTDMRRAIFDDEHEAFRETVATFLDKEVVPRHEQWERDGIVEREAWTKAGAQGLLGLQLDEQYGGGGTSDFRYNAVIGEEMTRRGVYGAAYTLFNDMIAPYLVAGATDEQKQRWFPALCSGETIAAIAMSEPGAGSDLQGIRTTALDAGDHYVLNGQKTFISNGILADLVVVVARTDPDAGHEGISLLVVERGMEGFERGRNLDKIGQHAQDTAELFFSDVRVPKANLLGEEGSGFVQLMTNLSQERLSMAVAAATACESIVEMTLAYAKDRTAFGRPIGRFQHNRFVIAEMATEAHVARVFVDDCIARHVRGELDAKTASMAKYWVTELQNKLVDRGVQMHGGYGYMTEYPIARAWLNSRVGTIYGGTTEIQKEIIGRSLGL